MLLGIVAYVILQLGIGLWVSRRQRTESDYLLAGRQLSTPLVALSVFATWFGAESCVGSAGSAYEHGLSGARADPFGYAICLVLMGGLLAARLRRGRFVTLGDLFRERFSPGVEKLAVLLMVPTSALWAGAQVRAFGQVLSFASGIDVRWTILIAAGTAVAYTVLGGLLADVLTDAIQGVVLITGLVVMVALVSSDLGGIGGAVAAIPRERLSFAGEAGLLHDIEAWTIPIVGSLFAQELAARALAARTPTVARQGALLAGLLYFTVGALPLVLGLIGPQLLPGLADPEQFLPTLAHDKLPRVAYVVFAGALVSAILSTVDSTLLVSASLVSHNVIAPRRPEATEADKVRWARWGVVVFGALACVFALSAESVVSLVEEASAFGSAGLVVAGALGLFTRFGSARSGAAALIVGVLSYAIAKAFLPTPYLVSLACAALAYVAFAARRDVVSA